MNPGFVDLLRPRATGHLDVWIDVSPARSAWRPFGDIDGMQA
jgi:hypothetical protein